jgi:hypothetical protein
MRPKIFLGGAMTDWWERGYPGGPMVKVAGFPRPLYPPDAADHGKTPSSDGPDVVAYKRGVSRAGRFPWAAFDDSFSNGFSHGKSGNVGETGVAGVQRQQHLDATGWIGEKTFNTLRSIVIPQGLPHAGEPALDQIAVNLINDAWDLFAGSEPESDGKGTVRSAALARAISQLGITESPTGSNNNKYGEWYRMNGVPWCAIFVSWCYELGAGDVKQDSPSFKAGVNYSYCPYVVSDARAGRNGLQTTDDPILGDLVVYDWEGNGEYDHIGLFEEWTNGTSQFNAIEGNTSTSNNSNGGQVMRRSRSRGAQGTVFVRVAEP